MGPSTMHGVKVRRRTIKRTPNNSYATEDIECDDHQTPKGSLKPCQPKRRNRNVTPAVRAEKSRNAAKYRRDREAEEFAHLTELLPFDPEVVKNLDKASVVRLATCYLHMKQITKEGLDALLEEEINHNKVVQSPELLGNSPSSLGLSESQLMLEASDGFLLFVTNTGRVIYASDCCESHLGIAQHELIGRGILEFIHSEDHREFVKQFKDKEKRRVSAHPALPSSETPISLDDIEEVQDPGTFAQERTFYVRMKCHLPRPGSKTKQFGHLLTQWTGKIRVKRTKNNNGYPIQGLVAVVRPLHSTPIIEIRLDGNMFMSRHELDMRYTFCDPRIINLVGYEPREVIGITAYQFHNPLDAQKIHLCHSNLIVKGTAVSRYYRFLTKSGEWIWMKTRATIIYNTNNEPQYIACLNYVYSDEEGKRYQMLEEEQNGHHQPDGVKAFTTFTSHMGRNSQSSPCSSPSSGYDSDSPAHNPFHDNTVCNGSPTLQQFQEPNCIPGPDSGNVLQDNLFSSPTALTSPVMTSPSPRCQPSPVYIDTMASGKTDQLDGVFDLPYKEDLSSSNSGVPLTFDPSLDVDWLDKMATDLMEASGASFVPTTRTAVFDHDYSVQPMDTQASITDVTDLNDLLDSSLLDENLANNTFLNGTKTAVVEQGQESALLQLLGSSNGTGRMSSNRPVSVAGTMTVSAFPKHLTSTIGPATNGTSSQEDFAIKFAENMVEQRMRQDMLNYLSEETDVLPCKSLNYASRDHSYTAPSTMAAPNVYSRSVKKNVPYTTASQSSNHRGAHSNGRHRRSTNGSRSNSPPTSPTKSENKASTLLEAMLLTKEPLNPNKGSDEMFQSHKQRVTQGLSRLNIEEEQGDGNLLKQLLTGEINDKQVHQYEQNIIENRKRDEGDSGHPSDEEADYPMLDLTFDNVVSASRPQRTLNLELFDAETAGDMANLLGPISPDMEMLMRSEIDDILREQTRQDDLWLQQYL